MKKETYMIPISLKTETDPIPTDSAIPGGANQSISEIISNLRSTFLPSDFDRAEAELGAREEALRREISRLKKENLQRSIMAEERRVKAAERFAAALMEKESFSAEVSELKKA